MRAESSNFNEYPHRVFASVILLDGKIVNWKSGQYRMTKKNLGLFNQPRIVHENFEKLEVRSRSFIVHNISEHNKAFEREAVQFYKQFKLYPGYNLMKPY